MPQCYIPSHKVIGSLVLEKKIFEGFLPYMDVAAILVMWPRPREQTFVPPSYWGAIWYLALIGSAVLEKKIFEKCRRTDRRTTDHGYTISSPKGSGELKICNNLETDKKNQESYLCPTGTNGKLKSWGKSFVVITGYAWIGIIRFSSPYKAQTRTNDEYCLWAVWTNDEYCLWSVWTNDEYCLWSAH